MRRALVPVFFLCAGCFPNRPYLVGTVDYTATSPSATTSGALPFRAIECPTREIAIESIKLGDRCTLTGRWQLVGRYSGSTTAELRSRETCVLPGANGEVLALPAALATVQSVGDIAD